MKLKELNFQTDSTHLRGYTYIQSCIKEPEYKVREIDGGKEEYTKFLRKILRNSTNTAEFTENFLANAKYKGLQGYQEVLKSEKPDEVWGFIRENFGSRCFKTFSDIGGVKVGTEDFSIVIRTGNGDGVTRVAVFTDKEEFYSNTVMEFQTSVIGKFNIYACDSGEEIAAELDGRYGIYNYEGFVAFVKWQ